MSATEGFPGELPDSFTYSTDHQEYQWAVWYSLGELKRLWRERSAEYGDSAQSYVPWHRDIVLMNSNVRLYSCLAAESAINFWATVRLGTSYLKRIEMRGLENKFCAITDRIASIALVENDEVRQALRRLITSRNALVHPKAIVGGPDDNVPPPDDPPQLVDAENAYRDMQSVINFIVRTDEDMWIFFP